MFGLANISWLEMMKLFFEDSSCICPALRALLQYLRCLYDVCVRREFYYSNVDGRWFGRVIPGPPRLFEASCAFASRIGNP
jgi:hypothetical protein